MLKEVGGSFEHGIKANDELTLTENIVAQIMDYGRRMGDSGVKSRELTAAADALQGRLKITDPYQLRQVLYRCVDVATWYLSDKLPNKFDAVIDDIIQKSQNQSFNIPISGPGGYAYQSKYSGNHQKPKYYDHVLEFLDWARENKIGIFKKNQFAQFHPTLAKFFSDEKGKNALNTVKKDVSGFFKSYLNIAK